MIQYNIILLEKNFGHLQFNANVILGSNANNMTITLRMVKKQKIKYQRREKKTIPEIEEMKTKRKNHNCSLLSISTRNFEKYAYIFFDKMKIQRFWEETSGKTTKYS